MRPQPRDPFAPAKMVIEYVDAAAGAYKTTVAVTQALEAAGRGDKIIFAMPTLKLISEWYHRAKKMKPTCPVEQITTGYSEGPRQFWLNPCEGAVGNAIPDHIIDTNYGHVLFITQAGLMTVEDWPAQAKEYELVMDEVMETLLSRKPFQLRFSHHTLTGFLKVEDLPEVDEQNPYYRVLPPPDAEIWKTEHRAQFGDRDQVYKLFEDVAQWILEGACLFTDKKRWDLMVTKDQKGYRKGLVTISGFRRPEAVDMFKRVTIMSALFHHTMLAHVWKRLGVRFVRSKAIKVTKPKVLLGRRKLKLYWLVDGGWSKTARNNAGGIAPVLELIRKSGAVDLKQPVCVSINKDDGFTVVKKSFPKAIDMPHANKGLNTWQHHNQLIYCSALNNYTPDIRWIEHALGVDSDRQRIGRLGNEVYQTVMRLSLRKEDTGSARLPDVTVVVMDRDVAEWLPQWFDGDVEVAEINSRGVVKVRKNGRPRIGDQAMTSAERMRKMRERKKATA